MTAEILAAVLAWYAADFSVFPLLPGSKFPAVKWKFYETVRPSTAQLPTWFARSAYNLGLMMGRISGGAFALDLDSKDFARLIDLEELARKTVVQETPRGFHILLRVVGEMPRTTTHMHHGLPVDLKSEGSYVVGAPSTLGPGRDYRLMSRALRVATVDRQEIDALIARLEAAWPGVRKPCLRVGRQGALDDFADGAARRPSILKLASFRRGER